MNKLLVSIVIITDRDDEKLLKAINSASFADEVLVVDNTQNGLKKTSQFTLIRHKKPINDFAATRNWAMKQAKHEWVFFLDSDERLGKRAAAQVAAVLDSSASGAIAHRSDIFLGKQLHYGEAGHQQIIRLGKKAAMIFHGKVHEVASIDGEIIHTNIQISHDAHDSISDFIADVSRYAYLAGQEKSTGFWQNLFELIIFPPTKLLYNLVIQGGMLDGWRGIVYAFVMSLHSLLVRIYHYETLAKATQLNQTKHSS